MKDFKFIAVILLGRPGSGKDTQAELLAKKFGLVHLISSKIIKNSLKGDKKEIILEGKKYDAERERKILRDGRLTTFTFVSALLKNEISKAAKRKRGIIMSASPRSKTELKEEWPLLKKFYNGSIFFIHIKISPKEVYVRNLNRHRQDLPELDTRKIINRRLKMFNHYTLPVIKLLKKNKRITEINGEQSIMKIHKDILWKLQSKLKKK